MKIGVVGSGYVGLVTGACLAEKGRDVTVMDIDSAKVEALCKGQIPLYEPGLEALVGEGLEQRHLSFTSDMSNIASSQIIFITVGTPDGENGAINTKYVFDAADSIGNSIRDVKDFQVIAVKSTVPPGTTRDLSKLISSYKRDGTFAVASNPEFLKEGSAVEDFRRPDRVIVGTDSEEGRRLFEELYRPFMRTRDRLIYMGIESAELTKLIANSMLATRIALMNEAAQLAGKIGADIDEVRTGIGSDPRIGPHFLFPSPGFGGSCLPKDTAGIIEYARTKGTPLSIVDAVNRSNRTQWYWLADRVLDYFDGNIRGKTLAMWGAAFKPRTDDVRHSPALYASRRLLDYGARVQIYDPQRKALTNLEKALGNGRVSYFNDVYGVLKNADALLIATDCDEFKGIDIGEAAGKLNGRVIIDARNLYQIDLIRRHDVDYISLGRPAVLMKDKR